MKRIPYFDISDHDEDARIHKLGMTAMERPGQKVGFITDDEPGKPERYIEKLKKRFPSLTVLSVTPGPVANVVTICVSRVLTS